VKTGSATMPLERCLVPSEAEREAPLPPHRGALIINADDWGSDRATTDAILECSRRKTISSASAMVFMEDSERGAALAGEYEVDLGLHLNFTSPFTAHDCPAELKRRQGKLIAYLTRHPMARIVFHPGLADDFRYVVAAQIDEYRRIHGSSPRRIDGHHHQHLCANVLVGGLLPVGTLTRRNFSFQRGEKSFINRFYRKTIDRWLSRNHRLVDGLYSLLPLEPLSRLQKIVARARYQVIELETHPINPEERSFLMGAGIFQVIGNVPIAQRFCLADSRSAQ
jgi:chitin disaccharide deacetylase